MPNFSSVDKDSFSELLLIVAGFILAETVVKAFLRSAQDALPWWVLPMFALSTIFAAIDLKSATSKKITGILYGLFVLLIIGALLLQHKNNVFRTPLFVGIAFWGSLTVIASWVLPRAYNLVRGKYFVNSPPHRSVRFR
ncbi:MAG: hypothetical protein ACP5NS_00820 [Candidatus Pacearchaeota archaeon]